jgi:hypothetical protein
MVVLQRRIAANPARVFLSNLGKRFIAFSENQSLMDFKERN